MGPNESDSDAMQAKQPPTSSRPPMGVEEQTTSLPHELTDSIAYDEATVETWRQDFLPHRRENAAMIIAATFYDSVGIWGPNVLQWAHSVLNIAWVWTNERDGGWHAVIPALLRFSRDEPSLLGTTATLTSEWTNAELDLFQTIARDHNDNHNDPRERSDTELHVLGQRLSMVLILHFFRLLYVEWWNGRVIPKSMATSKQSLLRTDAAALRVPLVVRRRFLEVFATQDTTTGDYEMTDPDLTRCELHILILYLNAHWQFDVARNDLSPAPLTADFTRFAATLGMIVEDAAILLRMAGCTIKWKLGRGTVTATLSYPPTYPVAEKVKKLGSSLHIDWGVMDNSTTTAATPPQSPLA